MYSKLVASGSYLPNKILTNAELAEIIDTSDEWIVSRTGIKTRHIAGDNEYSSDLAVKSLSNALANSGVDPITIDAIIVATTTPDQTFPATAAIVQAKMKLNKGFAFDINAVCSGFVYALTVADSLIKTGVAKTIAVIGVDTMSKILDWKDRSTCVLFGDGAGCFILEATDKPCGILSSCIYCDGTYYDILHAPSGIAANSLDPKVIMNGQEVFKHAVNKMISSSITAIERANLTIDDINWILPHQANQRILNTMAQKFSVDEAKVISTLAMHANTSAASIPIAFEHYNGLNKIQKGDNIIITAAGAGFTWGSIVLNI
jgi:3-oxoacyl-[acyl-carrier-protein] synthase-3